MTDAHCHILRGDDRHFLCDPTDHSPSPHDLRFVGHHPWETLDTPERFADGGYIARLAEKLDSDVRFGVGEIGMDRLKTRSISVLMRTVFERQLALAADFRRAVVLHGAKCWGEVVKACRRYAGTAPAFLFHGFSRSDGLISDIVKMNGYISIGPQILNDHAVNYRKLAASIPADRILVESDADEGRDAPPVAAIAAMLAKLRNVEEGSFFKLLEANADCFSQSLSRVRG